MENTQIKSPSSVEIREESGLGLILKALIPLYIPHRIYKDIQEAKSRNSYYRWDLQAFMYAEAAIVEAVKLWGEYQLIVKPVINAINNVL